MNVWEGEVSMNAHEGDHLLKVEKMFGQEFNSIQFAVRIDCLCEVGLESKLAWPVMRLGRHCF